MNNDQVTYQRDDVLRVLRHLECIVVSLDRIGSSTAESPESEQAAVLMRFFTHFTTRFTPSPFAGLAESRSILFSAFSRELGPDDMDELDRELTDVVYWSFNNRDGASTS